MFKSEIRLHSISHILENKIFFFGKMIYGIFVQVCDVIFV